MTREEFWELDPKLVISYRKAKDIKDTINNQNLWLQGFYNWQAFQNVIGEFAYGLGGSKGKKPESYPKYPIPISEIEKQQAHERSVQETLRWFAEGQKEVD